MSYHSPHPQATSALLVRNQQGENLMEWKTDPLPETIENQPVSLVWLFGIDVNEKQFDYKLFLNDELWFTFKNPKDTLKKDWTVQGKNGAKLRFKSVLVDRHGDLMGYAFVRLPAGKLESGKPVRLRVQATQSENPAWYMTFMYRLNSKISATPEPAILRAKPENQLLVRIDINHFGEPSQAEISLDGKTSKHPVSLGVNPVYLPVAASKANSEVPLEVKINGQTEFQEKIPIEPVKPIDLYLLHHTHVDIGYTHVQSEVEKIQYENLKNAIQYARESQNNPPAARFKWNVEVMWAVESFLKHATKAEKQALKQAVRDGSIELDALYANELTALCRQEELIRLTAFARQYANECGVELKSAMISDIPGYTWGLVTALAESGVKYFSIGTNVFHRIGSILKTWGDKPFYWQAPDGKNQVLCWVAGKGYSWFHTGLGYKNIKNKLEEKAIFGYLKELEAKQYPYDMSVFRYNIGSDNGPPDAYIAEVVKQWNEKYVSPKIIISTTSEAFGLFEEKYGADLPVLKGDLTPYWEDGAASTAKATALNRAAAERLLTANVLWAMNKQEKFPAEIFDQAWRNVMLFNEHTWGSWNSISAPHDEFTKQQWRTKRSFAQKADSLSHWLLAQARPKPKKQANAFDVYNPSSWERSEMIYFSPEKSAKITQVTAEGGKPLPIQRLTSGELAVWVENVPPLCAKRIFLSEKGSRNDKPSGTQNFGDKNEDFALEIDEKTGAITFLKMKNSEKNWVKKVEGNGLNDYLLVEGRSPEKPLGAKAHKIEKTDAGKLISSYKIQRKAPGCRSLITELRFVKPANTLEIVNILEKTETYTQEGVHFAFPFDIPQGEMRIDVAFGNYIPEKEQINASNKNYYTVQRWLDISNTHEGITWVSLDAPLIEIGEISTDAIAYGWRKTQKPAQNFFSYVMNNYWETNYKAAQGGKVRFRYALQPHNGFSEVQAERFALEQSRKLLVVPAGKNQPKQSLLQIDNPNVLISDLKPADKGKGYILRLYNASPGKQKAHINLGSIDANNLFFSNLNEEKLQKTKAQQSLLPHSILTLRLE